MKMVIASFFFIVFLSPGGVFADAKQGDKGAEVKQVQEHLRFVGGYSVKVDGIFGPQTARAVRHWQNANGLLVDGIVGPATAASLGIRGDQIQLTTPPSPPAPKTVEQIIREAWPDELEDHAVAIAWRESRFVPTAHNSCCHGLFQIYWSIHKAWLSTEGVTSLQQLYDPEVNARMAYKIYLRNNGWGPWTL
jgi:peptidoglycan hydrolase-like protein with peptidoglycan-binding domain